MEREAGWNADRSGCKTCWYRGPEHRSKGGDTIDSHGCSYILRRNRSRGCTVEDCTRYMLDRKLRKRKKKDA